MPRVDFEKLNKDEQERFLEIFKNAKASENQKVREEDMDEYFMYLNKMYCEHPVEDVLRFLNDREKKILQIATNAIYFDDSSKYIKALWDIVNEIAGKNIGCDSELFKILNGNDD